MEFLRKDTYAIKGIAIILMLFLHLFYQASSYEQHLITPIFFSTEELIKISMIGKICVSLFVFLTGYGFQAYLNETNNLYTREQNTSSIATYRWLKLITNFLFIYILFFIIYIFYDWIEKNNISIPAPYLQGDLWFRFLSIITDSIGLSSLFNTNTMNPTWWYMSLATINIFILPLLSSGVKKIGSSFVISLILLPRSFLNLSNTNYDFFIIYLPTLVFGIYCAEKNLLYKIKNFYMKKSIHKYAKELLFFFILFLSLIFFIKLNILYGHIYRDIINIFETFTICCVSFIYCSKIKFLYNFLILLGKHSMNIFLTHTFLYAIFFSNFFYNFRFPLLIFAVLIMCSLILSLSLEYIKKHIGFYKLQNFILNYIYK